MVSGIKTLKADEPCRLDVFISSKIDSYTRSYFTGLISDGKVTVNGKDRYESRDTSLHPEMR